MTELEEMEQYNYHFNEKLKFRPVTNLITYITCQGYGGYLNIHTCRPDDLFIICATCDGKKYIESTNICKTLVPINTSSQNEIDELNRVNS